MPAATNKIGLLAVTDKEFSKLAALLDDLDPDFASKPFDDGRGVKDVIAHRAHWIGLFLGWYADGQAGKDVAFPAPSYKWNQLKTYNVEMRDQHAAIGWQDTRANLASAHDTLVKMISDLDNTALYGDPMQGANNNWTTGRWAEAAGPSHYRSAAKFVRACKRSL